MMSVSTWSTNVDMHVSSRAIPAGMGGWRRIASCQNQQNWKVGLYERVVAYVIQISLNIVFDEIMFRFVYLDSSSGHQGKDVQCAIATSMANTFAIAFNMQI
jgi:hypothetical protein